MQTISEKDFLNEINAGNLKKLTNKFSIRTPDCDWNNILENVVKDIMDNSSKMKYDYYDWIDFCDIVLNDDLTNLRMKILFAIVYRTTDEIEDYAKESKYDIGHFYLDYFPMREGDKIFLEDKIIPLFMS